MSHLHVRQRDDAVNGDNVEVEFTAVDGGVGTIDVPYSAEGHLHEMTLGLGLTAEEISES